MLKLLARLFSTLAGPDKHEVTNPKDMGVNTKALKANKAIVAQQLKTLESNDMEIKSRVLEKEHLVQQLEKAVQEIDAAKAEVIATKTKVIAAQAEGAAEVRTLKNELREVLDKLLEEQHSNDLVKQELLVLREEQEQAVIMIKDFSVAMGKL